MNTDASEILEFITEAISDRKTLPCPPPSWHRPEIGDEVELAVECVLNLGNRYLTHPAGSLRGVVKDIVEGGAVVAWEGYSQEQWMRFDSICAVMPPAADNFDLVPHWEEEIPVYEKMGAMSRRVM